MHTVHAYVHPEPGPVRRENHINQWPTCSQKIHKQGRPGKKPRPVVAVRIKACKR